MRIGSDANESPSGGSVGGLSGMLSNQPGKPQDAQHNQDHKHEGIPPRMDSPTMSGDGDEDVPDNAEENRGRIRSRDTVTDQLAEGGGTATVDAKSGSSIESPITRKRRRSRKGLDKKFECPHPGCGKSYSRAEHLYRHQLNHQPKQIYFCDFPHCKRSFVRQDLCARHRERHTNKGSHLQRRDNLERAKSEAKSPRVNEASLSPQSLMSPEVAVIEHSGSPSHHIGSALQRKGSVPAGAMSGLFIPSNMADSAKFPRTTGNSAPAQRRATVTGVHHMFNNSSGMPGSAGGGFGGVDTQMRGQDIHGSSPIQSTRNPTTMQNSAITPTSSMHGLSLQSPFPTPQPNAPMSQFNAGHPNSSGAMIPISPGIHNVVSPLQQYLPFPLPRQASTLGNHPTSSSGNDFMVVGTTTSSIDPDAVSVTTGTMDIDTMSLQFTMPVFGESGYGRSPQWGHMAGMHELLDMLMGEPQDALQVGQGLANNPYFGQVMGASMPADMYNMASATLNQSFFGASMLTHPMNINTIAPPIPPRESSLSENKRQQLLDMLDAFPEVMTTFPEGIASSPACDILRHPLSLTTMQSYISLYWQQFHPQLPLMHRPTFSAEKTPDALLLCIIIIGMACVEAKQGSAIAQEAWDLANLISRSLRWTIFAEEDFRPPAKLWVFQALLLLEIFEKMYADRRLHERAHIHHATTLTLMRRGSSLIGRSGGQESPHSGRDAKSENEGSSSVSFSGQPGAGTGNSGDEAWNRWILQEATKRVAFAAFVVDATHANMFGHSAVMVAHEMRLQLPCDETLWAAGSASEVASIQQSLLQNNVTTPTFLEGLKKTLCGESVATNSFGRTILMAGLLSVAWHLHQRDVQISSLGVVPQLGGKERWRATLTQSFDHWRTDFDSSLAKLRSGEISYYPTRDVEHENIFESRTVLHHLAHISMHVDIVDLQIYAGVRRLLGRSITRHDAESTRKRMKAWASTAQARDAAFFSQRFLGQVLLPEESVGMQFGTDDDTSAVPSSKASGDGTGVPVYSARDDHLLNRPWVLYFACLVVWSYGHALEGPLELPARIPDVGQEAYVDMRTFLRATQSLRSPSELVSLKNKNACLGVLVTVKSMFAQCRWELLREASKLLNNCVSLSVSEALT